MEHFYLNPQDIVDNTIYMKFYAENVNHLKSYN
jgi:hypothetical protein